MKYDQVILEKNAYYEILNIKIDELMQKAIDTVEVIHIEA